MEVRQQLDFTNRASELTKIHPLILPAYQKLGADKVRELRYVKKEIKKELLKVDEQKSQDQKLATFLHKSVPCPDTVSCTVLIEILQEAYAMAGIDKKPKASHIRKWFECLKTTARIDGKSTSVYKIYTPKLIMHED